MRAPCLVAKVLLNEDGSAFLPTLKPLYRKQLLLYAAMHHQEAGTWPTLGHVVPLAGDRESIQIDPVEAEQEATHALDLLERYNIQAAKAESPWQLAAPSQGACRFCGFKAFCEPFWVQVSPDWDWARSVAIAGTVLQVRGGSGGWAAEVDVQYGNVGRGRRSLHANRSDVAEEGQWLRATNLMLAGEPPKLTVTAYTELRMGSSAGTLADSP